jgi:hypothetical protein
MRFVFGPGKNFPDTLFINYKSGAMQAHVFSAYNCFSPQTPNLSIMACFGSATNEMEG